MKMVSLREPDGYETGVTECGHASVCQKTMLASSFLVK